MRKKIIGLIIPSILLAIIFSPTIVNAPYGIEVKIGISVHATFLRAESFIKGNPVGGAYVQNPEILNLTNYGYSEGDWIWISYDARYYDNARWTPGDIGELKDLDEMKMVGVFSSTSKIYTHYELDRIPDAIYYGEEFETGRTRFKNYTTDIPEDFGIEPYTGRLVQVPPKAEYLMICLVDDYYPDNLGWIQITLKDGQAPPIPPERILVIIIVPPTIIITLYVLYKIRKKPKKR